MLVRVRGIPIRYGSTTYRRGDIFKIEEKYYRHISKYVDKISSDTPEEVKISPLEKPEKIVDEGDVIPFKKKSGITEEYLESLPYNDLKTFLKEQGVNIGKRRKHEDILNYAKEQLL
jgi:hypothetical protein